MRKIDKSGIVSTSVIYLGVLALFTILTFAIPFTKLDGLIAGAAYASFALLLVIQCGLTICLIFTGEEGTLKFLGLPVLATGSFFLIPQLLATVIFYIVNANTYMAHWVIWVVEAVLYVLYGICLAFLFYARNRATENKKTVWNTEKMDEFKALIKIASQSNSNPNLTKDLENLSDDCRSSDPVTSPKAKELEGELLNLANELQSLVESNKEDETKECVRKIRNTLNRRNAICKLGK